MQRGWSTVPGVVGLGGGEETIDLFTDGRLISHRLGWRALNSFRPPVHGECDVKYTRTEKSRSETECCVIMQVYIHVPDI